MNWCRFVSASTGMSLDRFAICISINKDFRKVVPVEKHQMFNMDARKQLGINNYFEKY